MHYPNNTSGKRMTSDHYESHLDYEKVTQKSICDRMRRFVNIAKAMYRKGDTSGGRTYNVTFVTNKSKLIAIGVNDYTRSMEGYNRKLKTTVKVFGEKSYKYCLHAEIAALLKLRTDDCSDYSFYNIRLTRDCQCIGNTFPCSNCLRMLNLVKTKNIYCYDADMNIVELV